MAWWQVHINSALAACGTRVQDLRATTGKLESPDWAGRMIQGAFADQNFASYFVSPGEHKSDRAHNAEESPTHRLRGRELDDEDDPRDRSLRGAGRRR